MRGAQRSVHLAQAVAAAALLAPVGAVAAQAPPTRFATGNWIVDRWSSDQGLPQNTVNAVLQSRDGFIWIATYGGLVRFDGVRFTTFSTHDRPGLGSDRIMAAQLANDGSIWLGTDRGLVQFKNGTFREWTEKQGRPGGLTTGLFPNDDGSVWVTTSIGGLALFKNEHFERFTNRGVPDGYVEGVVVDRTGAVWINRGAARFLIRRPGAAAFTPIAVSSATQRVDQFVGLDREGSIWFSTNHGSTRWTGSALENRSITGSLARDDGRGGYWSSIRGVMVRTDSAGNEERIPVSPDAEFGQIKNVFVDRDGTPWIGTNTMGLLRLRRRIFHMYTTADGLASDQIAAVFRDRAGRLLVGSNCSPTSSIVGAVVSRTTLPGCAFSFAQTPDGTVWFGGYGDVTAISPDGRALRITPDSLHSSESLALYADRDSTVWIGTSNGLIHVARTGWVRFSTRDGLPSNEIHFVSRDRSGNLWIGTIGGLARLDGGHFTAWTTRDGLPHNAVRAVYEDAAGIWWIGTYGGGLGRFDGTHFVTISTRDGLFDDIVSSIHEDAAGNLWMAGNRGVFRANRRALNAFASGQAPFVPSPGYGPADGLLTSETNGGFQPSSWQDADGRLWFATVRGLATVDPRDAAASTAPPSVAIDAMRVDGRGVSLDSALDLPVGSHSMEIDYTAMTAANPQQLVFRYRVEHLDRDWSYVNHRRTAYISQLATGRYTFVVTAANADGVWSPAEQRLSFFVPAPWYATVWFRAALAFAFVGSIAWLVRRRMEGLHERERRQRDFSRQLMAAQESERRRIAGELHDSLSQDLLVMKNRASMALKSIDGGLAVRTHIEEIVEVATQASRNAREISHNLRPHQLDHLGLAAAVRDLAARTSAAGEIEVTVHAGDADRLLGPDETSHVYRIIQEALNNVMKHAAARHVVIRMEPAREQLMITVTDDGRGFDLSQGLGFGLNGIGQRVQVMRGRMDVHTSVGRGVSIEIALPASPTHRLP